MSQPIPDISALFAAHLDELYEHLTSVLEDVWLPEKARIAQSLGGASFMTFTDNDVYALSARASQYPWRLSNTLGMEVYRVYFNEHSKKVYVDLNLTKAGDLFSGAGGFVRLGGEIVRSIMFTDPQLLYV